MLSDTTAKDGDDEADDGLEDEAFWGDEIVDKSGSFKCAMPGMTASGAVAIVKRDTSSFLVFKAVEIDTAGTNESLSIYVSWAKKKTGVVSGAETGYFHRYYQTNAYMCIAYRRRLELRLH